MAEEIDLNNPPIDPPDDPGAADDQAKPPEKPAAPTFSLADTTRMVAEGVKVAIKELTPSSPVTDSADAPTGPSPAELQQQIEDIDAKIDLAVSEGAEPSAVRKLNNQRDRLRDAKFDTEHVAPLRAQGSAGINELVIRQMETDPDTGEHFREYKTEIMTLLRPAIKAGQVLRLEVVQEATNLVLGRHMKEIRERDREATIRQDKDKRGAEMPGGTNGRARANEPKGAETVKDLFGDRADEAFRMKRNKGMDENAFAQRLGYKDKAEWFQKTRDMDNGDRSCGLDR